MSLFQKLNNRSHTLQPLHNNANTPIKIIHNNNCESDNCLNSINYKYKVKEFDSFKNNSKNVNVSHLEKINNDYTKKISDLKYKIQVEELKNIQLKSKKFYRKENLKYSFQKTISNQANNLLKEVHSVKTEFMVNNLRINQIMDPNYFIYLSEKLNTVNEGISVLRKHNLNKESKHKWQKNRETCLTNLTRDTKSEINFMQESNNEINKISGVINEITNRIQILTKNSNIYDQRIKTAELLVDEMPIKDLTYQKAKDIDELTKTYKILEGKKLKLSSEINILETKSQYLKKDCMNQIKYLDGQIISIKNQIDLHKK